MDCLKTVSPTLQAALWIALADPSEAELQELMQRQRCQPGIPCTNNPPKNLTPSLRRALIDIERQGLVAQELQKCRELGIRLVAWNDPAYPDALLDLAAPPPLLYLRGHGPWPPRHPLTIVGARKSTIRGRSFAREVAAGIARQGGAVISGLARGIDQAAHEGCAQQEGGCYAVLACGVDRIYPSGTERLVRQIERLGRIVSEMPIGSEPFKHRFPQRNRILAAWSKATIVIEADARSGSLITAHRALDLGREVFAVPGPIREPSSRGTNALIRDGATPLLELEDLQWLLPQASVAAADPFLQNLLSPKTPSELAILLGDHEDVVLARLLDLELAGKVRNLGGGFYGMA